jgi:hypothetical protein
MVGYAGYANAGYQSDPIIVYLRLALYFYVLALMYPGDLANRH